MIALPNFLAIILAAATGFLVGGVWYSKMGFGKQWMQETGITEEKAKQADMKKLFGGAFALNLLAALVLALYLKTNHDLMDAVGFGFAVGSCWVATSIGVNYLFEQKSLRLFLINGGYVTVQFTVMGLVLGLFL
ncbi:MAG: DUF1761 domain-containing protein [Gammaproteobacteria bacterium]|nr:DUF1761 domain-containing protein [Gammaproteobacteria bacterium]